MRASLITTLLAVASALHAQPPSAGVDAVSSPAPTAARDLARLGAEALEKQDPADAVEYFARALAQLPNNPDLKAAKGKALAQAGRGEEAEEVLIQSVYLGTEDPFPFYWLGTERKSRPLLLLAAGKAAQLSSSRKTSPDNKDGKGVESQLAKMPLLSGAEDVRKTLDSAIGALRLIDGDNDFEQDLHTLISWYPQSAELAAAADSFLHKAGN